MHPTLDDLEDLARGAGEILKSGLGERLRVDHKGAIDLVTEMDRRAESFLVSAVRERFPGHRILVEEQGALPGDEDRFWVIDPLDGTVNYAHGVPIYSVSIAYLRSGELELGLVFDPSRDECFRARRGGGAWLNGQPIAVSDRSDLDQSLLVTGFPYDIREHPNNNLDAFAHFALRTRGVRRLGSAAMDMCYVAAGRFDGFWEIRLNAWDVAAGTLIVREAGGTVTDLQGQPDVLGPTRSILAANPRLHPQILAEWQSLAG